VFSTARDSPLPFNRLGGDSGDFPSKLRPPTFETRGATFFRLVLLDGVAAGLKPDASLESTESPLGVELADSGLGGWPPSLLTCFGGCGKEPMLTVLRRDLPGGSGPARESDVLRVGRVEVELVWPLGVGRMGRAEEDTALLLARAGSSEPGEEREAGLMFEMRDFATGSEGSGPVGGAIEGRDGRGSEWFAMMRVCFFLGAGGRIRRRVLRSAASAVRLGALSA